MRTRVALEYRRVVIGVVVLDESGDGAVLRGGTASTAVRRRDSKETFRSEASASVYKKSPRDATHLCA